MPEDIERGTDRLVGARQLQLTRAAAISHNIHCEERYTCTDGSRVAFLRSAVGCVADERWLCDLETR